MDGQNINENLQLFEDQPIRTAWDETVEEWYFSVVDVVGALTEQPDTRHAAKYWSVLKTRLKAEGSELTTNCSQLKLKATDGKRRLTDVANTEQLLRIIQSIPSKKAEPFKLWLAEVGRERIEETMDPELIAERLVSTYERKGDTIYIHPEAEYHPSTTLQKIIDAKLTPGIAVNPGTSVEQVKMLLRIVKKVLVMSVNPGNASQMFLPYVREKYDELLALKKEMDILNKTNSRRTSATRALSERSELSTLA